MTTAVFVDPGRPPPSEAQGPPSPPSGERHGRRWAAAGLGSVVTLSLVLNCWNLSGNGLGNTYYAAAVRSMAGSWHNFFFAAFDPGGFISVDKPPVALWIQALSVRVFGYSSWSLLLPGALAGTAAVAVLWCIVRRRFGAVAAFVAALVLALTPISVAVDRLNGVDPFMILFLVLAAWAVLRSLDDERWVRWLIGAGAFVGLAFNTKMLAAYIPVPALAAALAVGTNGRLWARARRVLVFGAAALAFSLPWMAAVDLTPASARPYVGGSRDNSVSNLLFDYNGLGRVDGQTQGRGGRPPGGGAPLAPPGGARGGGFAGPGGIFGGQPGTLRLFSDAVGGQIAWLLPLAGVGAAFALWWYRRDPTRLAAVVVWSGWLALCAVVFSYAKGIFHSYYTSEMAPPLAAAIGVGGVALARAARRAPAWLWLGAGALLATGGVQLVLSSREPAFFGWVLPITCTLAVLAVVGLAAAGAGAGAGAAHGRLGRLAPVSLSVGLGALLLAPAAWAASETANPTTNATLPQAGPRGGASGRTFGSNAFAADAGLTRFLRSQHRAETWDVVTTSAMTGSGLAAQQGLSVLPLGGFGGSDPAATPASVASMVSAGKVRYFAAGRQGGPGGPGGPNGPGGFGGGPRGRAGPPGAPPLVPFGGGPPGAPGGGAPLGGPGGRGTAATIMSIVTQTCTPVTSATTGGRLPSDQDGVLYDCAGRGAALAAAAAS